MLARNLTPKPKTKEEIQGEIIAELTVLAVILFALLVIVIETLVF